jgi:hypothetical protein
VSDEDVEAGSEEAVRRVGSPDAPGDRGSRLAYVAHEVRNPLSTALWSAELLARLSAAERGGARGQKLVALCLRSLARLRTLVEDHFLAERLDAGGLPQEQEALVLAERIREVAGRRPAGSAALEVDVDEGLAVVVDRFLLDRILEALLAVAGGGDAPVRVEGSRADGGVALRIWGTAPPPWGLDDPLRGAPPDASGRALSLPVARRAAEAVGGSLRIEEDGYLLRLPARTG